MDIRSHQLRRLHAATVLTLCALALTGCAKVPGVYTYVSAADKSAAAAAPGAQDGAFDAKAYVAKNWQSRVLPTVEKDAVPATELLPALASDQQGASTKYGNQAGTGSPYAFLVRGTGTVTKVDADAPTHPLTVQVEGLSGAAGSVQVVTGPVIAGAALRDAVKFVKFSDFTNQLDYADVGTELNNQVKSTVLGSITAADLVGKKITFAGAFSLVAPGVVVIVPTELKAAS